jgi:hypothetical protein
MCRQQEIELNRTYNTLWSIQPELQPVENFLTDNPPKSIEVVQRLERWRPSGSWSDVDKAQFLTPTFEKPMTGAEILAQQKKNPPNRVPRVFTIYE